MTDFPLKKVVVIVDDDAEVREVLRRIIEPFGYSVAEFADGASAFYYIKNPKNTERIVCIISDLMMNKRDGLELLQAVRQTQETKHVKFYFVTGASLEVFENLLGKFSYDKIIEKPFRFEQIEKLLGTDAKIEAA